MDVTTAPATAAPTTAVTGTTTAPADGAATAPVGFEALLAALLPGAAAQALPDADPDAEPGAQAPADPEATEATEPDQPATADPTLLLAMLVVPPVVTAPAPTSAATTATTATTATPADTADAAPATAATPGPTAAAAAPTDDAPAPATPPVGGVVGAVAPAATVATPAAGETKATVPVSRQVFDTIEKLTTAGNGTHRVTLRLDPGTLGEVRVHLTVRDGEVRVRLSAGAEAQKALGQGAGDLGKLLEGTGASKVRVDVRALHDAPAPVHPGAQPHGLTTVGALAAQTVTDQLAATALTTGTDNGAGTATGGQQHDLLGARQGSGWTGGDTGSSGAHAGTQGATTARDGDQDRVEGPASADPSTTGPRRGVDVRM